MLSLLSLALALAVPFVKAGGIIDNTAIAAAVNSEADATFSNGDYYVQNVANGKFLQFIREDVTNVYPRSEKNSVTLEQYSGNAYIIEGLTKCMSAQWGFQTLTGADDSENHAGVSYACRIGSEAVSSTVEITKQYWYFVPTTSSVTASSSSSSSDEWSSSSEEQTYEAPSSSSSSSSQNAVVQAAVNNVEVESSSSSEEAPKTQAQAQSVDAAQASHDAEAESQASAASPTGKTGYEIQWEDIPTTPIDLPTSTDPNWQPQTTQSIDSYDRSTWVCKHPGWWLARHPGYISDGETPHPECKDDLIDYWRQVWAKRRRLARRSRHQSLRRRMLETRGQTVYTIITADHLYDMTTKALTGSSMSTYGGYTSTALADWDEEDPSQQWTVSKA